MVVRRCKATAKYAAVSTVGDGGALILSSSAPLATRRAGL
jgi:hypothetical protein